MTTGTTMTGSLYAVLGVAQDAKTEEIKRAYRRAARVTHPDLGGDPAAFWAVRGAYEVLVDPGRRARVTP